MSTNKIGFNNFKAFGEKMQTFSKKPITLVYGPNSIGKSSLLHSQLYFEYLRSDGVDLDFNKTNFAGDTLDFNGFENFIHRHDKTKTLSYKLEFFNHDDINNLFTPNYSKIKSFDKNGIIDKLLDKKVIKETLERIKEDDFLSTSAKLEFIANENSINYFTNLKNLQIEHEKDITKTNDVLIGFKKRREDLRSGHKTDYLFKYIKTIEDKEKKLALLNTISSNAVDELPDEITKDFEVKLTQTLEKFKNSKNKTNQLLMLASYGSRENDFEAKPTQILKKFKDSKTQAEEISMLSKKSKIESFYTKLIFFKYIASVNSIKINVSLKMFGSKLSASYKYFINNELLFEADGKITINMEHTIIKMIINNDKRSSEGNLNTLTSYIENVFMPANIFEDLISNIDSMYTKINIDVLAKYMPLSIIIQNLDIKAIAYLNKLDDNRKAQYFGPLRFYPKREDLVKKVKHKQRKSPPKKLKIPLSKANSIFWKKPFIYLNMNFLKHLFFNSDLFNDILNEHLSDENKLTTNDSNTSTQVWSNLIASKDLQDKLNCWLSNESKLKSKYKVEVKNIDNNNELVFVDLRTNTEVTPRDMGLGISQALPIIISCLDSHNKDIFMEQPELHLHPAVQAELADEFIRSYKERDNKFIIETHSEHLLLRIMRRMRYTAEDKQDRDKTLDLTPDDVCLLYVDNDGDSTSLQELRLSKSGKLLDHWPNGFFEEGFKERFS